MDATPPATAAQPAVLRHMVMRLPQPPSASDNPTSSSKVQTWAGRHSVEELVPSLRDSLPLAYSYPALTCGANEWRRFATPARTANELLMFVVVEGFPEADPDIEQSQAAAQAAKKAGGDEGTKPGE